MVPLESVQDIIASHNIGTTGVDLFLYGAPATSKDYILILDPPIPAVVDDDLPGYYHGKFQIIVRNQDYTVGMNICKQLLYYLKLNDYEDDVTKIKMIRATHLPRVFRRSLGGEVEFSISFQTVFIEK